LVIFEALLANTKKANLG